MLFDFFGLREDPFGVTPETRFLYPSSVHEEARASLAHSFHSGRGFVVLVGQPGMGKTTLLMDFLQKLKSSARTAFLFQTQCSSHELLEQLMLELNLGVRSESPSQLHDRLRAFLAKEHSTGKRVVIVVDEAQNLQDPVLETVRLLSDFETQRSKLLHIVLSGQPQLADKLMAPGLLQLRQRIGMVCRLSPLTTRETREYIQYRLMVAGRPIDRPLFSPGAYEMIAELSKGIPRNINNICFHALSIAYPLNRVLIDTDIVDEASSDIDLSWESSSNAKPCVVTASAPTKSPRRPEPRTPSVLRSPVSEPAVVSPVTAIHAAEPAVQEAKAFTTVKFSEPQNGHTPTNDAISEDQARTLSVLSCIPRVNASTHADWKRTGAAPAVAVSGFWRTERNRLAEIPPAVEVPIATVAEAEKTEAAPQVAHAEATHDSSDRLSSIVARLRRIASGENVLEKDFHLINRIVGIIVLVTLAGTVIALWPELASVPAWFSGKSEVHTNALAVASPLPMQPESDKSRSTEFDNRTKQAGRPHRPGIVDAGYRKPDNQQSVSQKSLPQNARNHSSWKAAISHTGDLPLLSMTEPQYPLEAQATGIEGIVVLDATVESNGSVSSIRAVSGNAQLIEAAANAVKQWHYDPQGLSLRHSPIHQTVQITFTR